MRHPTTHSFLKWAGSSVIVFCGGIIGLLAALAGNYPGIKKWSEDWFYLLYPIMTAPWFVAAMIFAICAYIWALVWTGQERKATKAYILDHLDGLARALSVGGTTPRPVAERRRKDSSWVLSLLPEGFKTAEQRYEDRLERERQALLTQAELDRANVLANHQKRRALLDECRDLAHKYTRNDGDLAFRAFLEGERAYADIRGHLSAEYLAKLNAPRTLYVCADGARYPTLVSWFLNDLDRLEKEWGLV